MEIMLHAFVTSAVNRVEWSATHIGRWTSGEKKSSAIYFVRSWKSRHWKKHRNLPYPESERPCCLDQGRGEVVLVHTMRRSWEAAVELGSRRITKLGSGRR